MPSLLGCGSYTQIQCCTWCAVCVLAGANMNHDLGSRYLGRGVWVRSSCITADERRIMGSGSHDPIQHACLKWLRLDLLWDWIRDAAQLTGFSSGAPSVFCSLCSLLSTHFHRPCHFVIRITVWCIGYSKNMAVFFLLKERWCVL